MDDINCLIRPVHLKGNQSWIFIGRTNAEAEAPILWLPDAKNWLIGKDPDDGKDWRQEEKGMTEGVQAQHTHWSLSATLPLHHCYKMGFSRQGCWGGLPFPPPGDLPNPGIEPESCVSPALQADSLPAERSGKPITIKLLTKSSPGWDAQFWEYEPALSTFDWKSNKAIFNFTQSSIFEIWFSTRAQRLSFWHHFFTHVFSEFVFSNYTSKRKDKLCVVSTLWTHAVL